VVGENAPPRREKIIGARSGDALCPQRQDEGRGLRGETEHPQHHCGRLERWASIAAAHSVSVPISPSLGGKRRCVR
jgi:hypothetical protein